ncbi:hypothetical protein DINM_002382 [Dirofilaria immitis]|nr:hypothetical protein [Dirofilaria immitis]
MALEVQVHSIPTGVNRAIENSSPHSIFAESIQHELNMFYSSLNAEEKIQLKNSPKQNEAAGLFGKLIGLRDIINTKLDTMQPESRLFIEKLLRRFLAAFSQDGLLNILEALKGFGKEAMDIFDGLSKPIQNDILKAFPVFGDIARLILRKLAETNLISRTSILTPTVDQNRDDSGKQSTLSPQVIVVEEPEDSDVEATHNTHYGKKK